MAEQPAAAVATDTIKIPRFLNDYRKAMAALKVRSFYANHLCKRRCLEGKLDRSNQECLQGCDEWLRSFFTFKEEVQLDQTLDLNFNEELPLDKIMVREKMLAQTKQKLKMHQTMLEAKVEEKVKLETKK